MLPIIYIYPAYYSFSHSFPHAIHMKKQLAVLCSSSALGSCQQRADAPAPASSLLPIGLSSYHEDANSYIQFMPGQQALGLAACDAVRGQFALDNSSQLTISQLTTTKGSCTSPVFGPAT